MAGSWRIIELLSDEFMKIDFERTGGFTAIPFIAHLDTDFMPPEEGREAEALVQRAGFINLPSSIQTSSLEPDRFQYVITVQSGGRVHTVRTSDQAAPEELYPLIDFLTSVARGPSALPISGFFGIKLHSGRIV